MEERKPEPPKAVIKPESIIVTPKEDTLQKGRDLYTGLCTVHTVYYDVLRVFLNSSLAYVYRLPPLSFLCLIVYTQGQHFT